MKLVGLRPARLTLRPWLWLTGTMSYWLEVAMWEMHEWDFRLMKMVERNEDE